MESNEFFSQGLNPPQKQAVNTLTGPLLILAGAGSGKTRVLTYRTANLIAQGLASPQNILAVTFTNKAAREMESRILTLLRQLEIPVFDKMWISTFHSICARILREHIHLLDYKPFFGIYDSSDQLSQIKKVLNLLNIDDKTYPAKGFQARINHAKTEGLTPDAIKRRTHLMDAMSQQVFEHYELEMKKANSLDFADLLLKTHELFKNYPVVLEAYQDKFKFIMVDEYQDTNRIQYLLIKQLASKTRNLCVVGDEDQSIYSWRGADITNILTFEKDFSEAVVIKLEQNYRSSQTIVQAASAVIRNNTQRKDKTLYTENASGDPIRVREETNEYEEARFVVKDISGLLQQGEFSAKDIAIFYRTNAQSRVLEEQFRVMNIPYRLVGGIKFYERMEIKDVLGYMKLALNPGDDIALKRIINTPVRGIGKTTVERIEDYAGGRKISMFEALPQMIDQREFGTGPTRKLREFWNLVEKIRENAQKLTLHEFYLSILDLTQYVQKLKEEDTPEADSRIENLEEFDNAISKFCEERGEEATLQSFLEEMSLVSDVDDLDENAEAVTMMTLHISKGLEYPIVYIVGLEEGLFPSGRSTDSEDPTEIEEERRLAYVGMTRAEKQLTLTYARTRRVWGAEQFNPPSRFLKEIPAQYVAQQSSMGRPRFVQNAAARLDSSNDYDFDTPRNSKPWNKSNAFATDKMPNYEDFNDDTPNEASAQPSLKKGNRVRHPSYGVGSVLEIEGSGDNMKVSVVFNDRTVKKFVVKYARLEMV